MNVSSFRAVALAAGLFFLPDFSANAVVFLVTTNGDSGAGTLRQAITDANATPGRDEIYFSIDAGPKIIQAFTPLPAITDPVDLNAATQPGYSNAPIITLVGTGGSQNAPGLQLATTDSSIVGFWIHGFRFVPGILLTGGGEHVIAGCQVGSFTPTLGNAHGIVLSNSVGNQIGLADLPNLISGNFGAGILLSTSSSNVIQGNLIGTDPAGASNQGNQSDGIRLIGADHNTIGGRSPGVGNLISGNGGNGIFFSGADGNVIEGNRIGCDAAGANAIPNRLCGVNVFLCEDTVIGGIDERAGNIISGNAVHGIEMAGSPVVPEFNVIQGNLIGTDATGMSALPNGGSGIFMTREVGAQIGGTEPGAANVISGNLDQGLWLVGGRSNVVQGNFIGVDRTGNAALPNAGAGVRLNNSSENLIGGSEEGSRNIISGNIDGIKLDGASAQDNVIQGNFIGVNRLRSAAVPNRRHGVYITESSSGTTVGGTEPGEGNLIAFNAGDGVRVEGNALRNPIIANSIHSNARLGINLKPASEGEGVVTPNDIGDADIGANNLQNFPVLTNVVYLSFSTIVQGYLRSSTNGSFSIDVYANVATESTGHGEGQFYVGNVDVDTGATGVGFFSFVTPNVFSNQFFTATALNYDTDDTSEFSAPMGGVRITSISQTTGLYHVRFTTITNRNYFLERATNLHSPVMWTTIQTLAVTRGTGGEKTITDPELPGMMRFYRIREQR